MNIDLTKWVAMSHLDYTAGRSSWDDPTKSPTPTAIISRPGESKSSQIEQLLPNVLEQRLLGALPDNDLSDLPELLVGQHVHWSDRGLVCVATDNANMRDAPDYRGFLVPRKDGTSAYTKPDLVTIEQMAYDAGARIVVLFFDEFLGADHLTQKALTDVFLNGRFGNYSLRRTTWVLGAANRVQDGAGVNRALSILTNRINVLNVELPVQKFLAWAREHAELPEVLLMFIKQNPGKATVETPPKDAPFPSYRSLTFAGQWLAQYKQFIGDDDPMTLPLGDTHEYAQAKVAGFIGAGLLVELTAYARVVSELPTIDDILANPSKAKLPATGRMDAAYAASQMLVYYATPQNVEQLWVYMERLPKELQVSCAKDLVAKGKGVVQNSAILKKFLQENSALIRSTLN